MDTVNPDTQELLAKLERARARRHWLQNILSSTFMIAIVILMVLLTGFNIYALNRLQAQTADLRSTVLIKQRIDANTSANAAARNVKDIADDMGDLARAAQEQIARTGVSPAQARRLREDARLYLVGARQRLAIDTRNAAAVADSGRRVRGLSTSDAALLTAASALVAFDAKSVDLIDPAANPGQASKSVQALAQEIPELKHALDRIEALARFRPDSETRAALAQLSFIVAQRLNYRADLCLDVGALAQAAVAARPFPLKVVINNADCLRKNGSVKEANAEFTRAVAQYEKSDPTGAVTPLLNYRALRGRATTAIAMPDIADKAQNDAHMEAAISDLRRAAQFSRANGETPAQSQGILENIGLAYLRMNKYEDALTHTKRVDLINPMPWNLTVQAIAASASNNASLARDAREKLRAFRRQQFNECELALLLGPNVDKLKPILERAEAADFTPTCPKGA